MQERGVSAKQLIEGSDISERRIKRYLKGILPKRVPLKLAVLFCLKFNIGFKEILTTEPPKELE